MPSANQFEMTLGARLAVWTACAQVFLLLVFPLIAELERIRTTLLVMMLISVAVVVLRTNQSGLHWSIVAWTYLLTALNLFFVFEGFFTGAPGAEEKARVYVLYPWLYIAMIAGIRSYKLLNRLRGVFVVSTICIAVYCALYLLLETGILPRTRITDLLLFDWDSQEFALSKGFVLMQVPGLNSIPFLLPFALATVTIGNSAAENKMSFGTRILWWAAVFSGLTVVFLAGRRAFYVVTLTAPILIAVFSRFLPMRERRFGARSVFRATTVGVIVAALIILIVGPFFGVTFGGLAHRLAVGFDFSSTTEDGGASQRSAQFQALLAGWTRNMFLGAGHGAPVYGYYSSDTSPWNFELGYMALLYQIGVVGVMALAAGVLWIYWKGVQVIRAGGPPSGLMIASLVGMSSMLIAHATNPYLARFDGMWAIFFPLGVINWWLCNGKSNPGMPTAGQMRSSY